MKRVKHARLRASIRRRAAQSASKVDRLFLDRGIEIECLESIFRAKAIHELSLHNAAYRRKHGN